jgi:hypothetical protein
MVRDLLRVVNDRGERRYPSLRLLSRAARERGVDIGGPNAVRRMLLKLRYSCRRRPRSVWRNPSDAGTRRRFAAAELRLGRQALTTRLFSDEKIFDCSKSTNDTAWVLNGKKVPPRREQSWSPTLHVWGLVGHNVRKLIVLKPGGLTKERYIKEALAPSLPLLKEGVFMQDGAPCHTAHKTINYLTRHRIDRIENWPPRSPDLNPIENIWGILQRRVALCGPTSEKALRQFVCSEFAAISDAEINRPVASYRGKLQRCVRDSGN